MTGQGYFAFATKAVDEGLSLRCMEKPGGTCCWETRLARRVFQQMQRHIGTLTKPSVTPSTETVNKATVTRVPILHHQRLERLLSHHPLRLLGGTTSPQPARKSPGPEPRRRAPTPPPASLCFTSAPITDLYGVMGAANLLARPIFLYHRRAFSSSAKATTLLFPKCECELLRLSRVHYRIQDIT